MKWACPFEGYEKVTGIIKGHVVTYSEGTTIKESVDLSYTEENRSKPILSSLSDFNKWIIKDIKSFLDINHNQCMELLGFIDGEIKLENISLGLYNAMCKKHIDFNNLIEEGLAVDWNTLNK